MNKISIGDKVIGDGEKCFIVFEAGPTHSGLESALQLVDIASEAGADAIKFQVVDIDKLMGERTYKFSYTILLDKVTGETEEIEEPLYEIIKRRELKKEEWIEIKNYCDKKNLVFFATACFEKEVDFLIDELKIPSIKIGSGDVNHLSFIKYVASKGINVQLDTGSSEIWEIERAINIIEDTGNRNIIIHHCPSGYPARLESIYLNMIKTLKTMFDYPIAFSDHTPGYVMDIAALSLGVNLLEKTITPDRTIRSCEHMFSLEKKEAKEFVETIREVEIALGTNRRTLSKMAREGKLKVRRSAFANRDLQEGDIINLEDIEFRRPGNGILADEFDYLSGRKLNKDISNGQLLKWEDLV